jgi:hypothetical protein
VSRATGRRRRCLTLCIWRLHLGSSFSPVSLSYTRRKFFQSVPRLLAHLVPRSLLPPFPRTCFRDQLKNR